MKPRQSLVTPTALVTWPGSARSTNPSVLLERRARGMFKTGSVLSPHRRRSGGHLAGRSEVDPEKDIGSLEKSPQWSGELPPPADTARDARPHHSLAVPGKTGL